MAMKVEKFEQLPIMGILRGGDYDVIAPLVETVVGAGLETLEIAMNTPNAAAMIRRVREVAGTRLVVGAGTVMDLALLDEALEAGARFIVMPTVVDEVVGRCRELDIPVFPGALTPQEIHRAWRAGATMVKLFPAKVFGPEYLREIGGPFPHIKLLACGGVSVDNLAVFFSCGASAVAFGSSVFRPEWLANREFARIGEALRGLLAALRRARPGLAG